MKRWKLEFSRLYPVGRILTPSLWGWMLFPPGKLEEYRVENWVASRGVDIFLWSLEGLFCLGADVTKRDGILKTVPERR
jgi:hypothetical protein